jgi:hypothetical protein
MNTLRIVGSVALVVTALWICVRYRRLFLIERGPVGVVRFLSGVFCLALLGFASWAGFYAVTLSPEPARVQIYNFLPLLVGTCYFYQIFTFKDLPKEWKRSPLFIMAMLTPILGCVLMAMVWWHDRGRLRYMEQKELMQ